MLRKFTGSLTAIFLAVACSLTIAATSASAQSAFRDDAPTNDGTTRTRAVAASITVTAPYAVTSIEAPNRVTSDNNQKFFIIDSSTNTLVYASPPKAFAADGFTVTYKASDLFPAVTLQTGKTYYIGAIVDQSAYYPFRSPPAAVTQGVVTNAINAGMGPSNGNVDNYANPTIGSDGVAQSPIRLNTVPVPAPVPTMTEWAMILLGLMLAGGAAMMIQRRRMAA